MFTAENFTREELLAEAEKGLREGLKQLVHDEGLPVIPDYVEHAVRSLQEVWAPGESVYNIELLGDTPSTKFAESVDGYSFEEYVHMGCNLTAMMDYDSDVFRWGDCSPAEDFRRHISERLCDAPFRVLWGYFEDNYGLDITRCEVLL